MDLGKPSAVSIGAWVALIAIAIYLIFVATHKSDTENYSKGATHYEQTIAPVEHAYPLCCARFEVRPDGTAVDLDRKKTKDKK